MPTLLPLHRRARALFAAVALVAVAACGDAGATPVKDGAAKFDKGIPTLPTPTTHADVQGKPCKAATGVPKAEGKPEVKVPEGPPPTALVKTDLTVGTGAEVKVGDTMSLQYVGIACSSGKQFDSSWDTGQPAEIPLSDGSGLIKGWTQGVPGMKVGGRRQLVIPPDLAYGAEGNQGIAPNETLVFVIDLLKVTPPPTSTTTAPGDTTTAPASTAPGSSVPEGADQGSSTTTTTTTTAP